MEFDLILKGGMVIDGSGGPPFRADVGVIDTMISAVETLDARLESAKTLDVTGHYVTPGFIDAHVHGDLMLLADPIHRAALKQGVTTYIIGQDGSSFAPGKTIHDRIHEKVHGRIQRQPARGFRPIGKASPQYLERFDRKTSINVAYLIPNGNVRIEVMGHDNRPATDDELTSDAADRPRGDGRRLRRPVDGPRLHPEQLCRRPRDRGALRGDRRRRWRLCHAHEGLWTAVGDWNGGGLRDRQASAGSPATSRTTMDRPT